MGGLVVPALTMPTGLAVRNYRSINNYTAGGIGSLRGFAYGSVGPNALYFNPKPVEILLAIKNKINVDPDCYNIKDDDGCGNVMGTASVELIMPTPFVSDKNQNSVRTSLFVDAASVWDTHWDKSSLLKGVPIIAIRSSRIRASAGISFQW